MEIGVGGRGCSGLWYGAGSREVEVLVKVFGLEIKLGLVLANFINS